MAKGFKAPKGQSGGSKGGMMGQLQKLQEQLEATRPSSRRRQSVQLPAVGQLEVTVTGDQRCQAVEIDPELLKDGDVEMVQDLLLTAFNSAWTVARNGRRTPWSPGRWAALLTFERERRPEGPVSNVRTFKR